MFAHIGMVFGEHVLAFFDERRSEIFHAAHVFQGQHDDVVAAHFVEDDHIERRGGRSLRVEAAHVEPFGVGASVNKLMHLTLVAVKGEDNGFIFREILDEYFVADTVWMKRRVDRAS